MKIWMEGIELVKETYRLVAGFPSSEKFGLASQITRAAVSIPSNIAEGCSRSSKRDFGRFLEIALGSAYELETQMIVAKEMDWVGGNDFESVFEKINKEQRGISSLIHKLKSD